MSSCSADAASLIKALWHDGIGLSLYAKRLDRGRFVWPVTVDGVVALAQPTTHVAATERGIGLKNVLRCRKKSPQIADFMIPSGA
jgi:transposase